ncbi:uncharacterized protein LOC123008841 [Tribolium madens]|uniref:uncharacterized protein LOC123008841 n=1 Tax=Tribolium madens TaxID=41895 RepID=UPI001CF7420B|nr:uncharacterized protein LOC123008841 [Tribolium madens]
MNIMRPAKKRCFVPWCKGGTQLSKNIEFFTLPTCKIRRRAWLQALNLMMNPSDFQLFTVCSRHFKSGRPSSKIDDVDWVPNQEIKPPVVIQIKSKVKQLFEGYDSEMWNIIRSIPEIEEAFDVPEYVVIKEKNTKSLPKDEKGFYNHDHDYLGTPIFHTRRAVVVSNAPPCPHGHEYALNVTPACQFVDLVHFCNICVEDLEDLFSFNRHMLVHMHKNDVECKVCHQSFFTTTCLNNHIKDTHTALCQKCHRRTPVGQLYWHELVNAKQKHKILPKCANNRNERIWCCVFCGKKIGAVRQFNQHMATHKTTVQQAL